MIWTLEVPRPNDATIDLNLDEETLQWTCNDELLQTVANQVSELRQLTYDSPALGDIRYIVFNAVARIFDASQVRFNEEPLIDQRVY